MSATNSPMTTGEGPVGEQWRPVPDWTDYEVSSLGRVRSLKRGSVRLLKLQVGTTGYLMVSLCQDGKRACKSVHCLVADAFHGPRPAGMDVRHLDGSRTNSASANLCYGTRSENNRDTIRHGHNPLASRSECAKGHPFDSENTYWFRGYRECRTCKRANNYASQRRRRALQKEQAA